MAIHDSAKSITAKAKSNLAFALLVLPREKRKEMSILYAFCRLVDDIVDSRGSSRSEQEAKLDFWELGIRHGFTDPDPVQRGLLRLKEKYTIPSELFLELIHGVRMDLYKERYHTFEELKQYCYGVASVVGLISLRILEATHPSSTDYAINLGYALQLTNIIRDVGQDLREYKRIYIPLNDLDRFQYTERDLLAKVDDGRFRALMEFQYGRTKEYYRKAEESLAEEDKKKLFSAEMMRRIYSQLLRKMQRDGFPVLHKPYRMGRGDLFLHLIKGWGRKLVGKF